VRRRHTVPGEPLRLAANHTGVWVGTSSPNGEPALLLHYDGVSGTLLQTITVREGVGPMAAGPNAIFVMRRDTNQLAQIEPGATRLTPVIGLSGPIRSVRYAAGSLLLIFQDEDTIARVRTDGRDFVTASAGHNPTQALMAGDHVFVSSRNDHSVLVLHEHDLLEAAPPLRVGLNPVSMVDDGRSVWVVSLDNKLTRIDYR
jgi:hypothetical protein